MRKRLLSEFDRIWVDNLNGSKFETGKVAPDGSPDPSVFSTEANREGIQVGTAVALLTKRSMPGADWFFIVISGVQRSVRRCWKILTKQTLTHDMRVLTQLAQTALPCARDRLHSPI